MSDSWRRARRQALGAVAAAGLTPDKRMSAQIIPTIVYQHAEEAAFLWILRDATVWAPHCNLKNLARFDERVEAQIDRLRVDGDEGWRLPSRASPSTPRCSRRPSRFRPAPTSTDRFRISPKQRSSYPIGRFIGRRNASSTA